MFRVTALGHQGWLIGSEATHVLVDPILTARFTRMPLSGHSVFPPRRLALADFPPIDAVLISHEHPDHLDFVSLQLLDRRTPVLLSSHASEAARRVIESIGLEVRPLVPGVTAGVGDLEILPFAPHRIGDPGDNEIDVVPLLVRDRGGHGSFFSAVDLQATRELAGVVRDYLDAPGVWIDSNSGFDRGLHYDWCRRMAHPVDETARMLAERYVAMFDGWGHPEIMLVTDNGLTLGGDLAPLNAHVFEVSNEELLEALRARLPGHRFGPATPGVTVELRDGELAAVHESRRFVSTDERDRWPARGGAPLPSELRLGFVPATGRRTLTAAERDRLASVLDELGRFLFARESYRGLAGLMAGRDYPSSQRPTVAVALRHGDAGELEVWELVPQRCAFVPTRCRDPVADYVAGIELWASDALAVLTLDASVEDVLHFGRKRLWNAAASRFRCDLDTEMELFAHPLSHVAAAQALYARTLDPDAGPTLPGPAATAAPDAPTPQRHRRPILRPVPAASATAAASIETSPADPGSAVEGSLRASLAAAVQAGSSGAWTLASVARADSRLRAQLTLLDGACLHLDIAPAAETARCYRQLGGLAFSYVGSSLDTATLRTLDGVIAAIAPTLRR